MKVCAISGDRKYLRLGATFDNSRWYTVTDKVKEIVATISRGDEVEVKAQQKDDGKLYLTEIKKTASAPVSSTSTSKHACEKCGKLLKDDSYPTCYNCSMKEKNSPENLDKEAKKQATIRRQAIGHMTSRALISLQGIVDVNNITSIAETLYKKFRTLVEEE